MSHGQAILSILGCSLVIHFILYNRLNVYECTRRFRTTKVCSVPGLDGLDAVKKENAGANAPACVPCLIVIAQRYPVSAGVSENRGVMTGVSSSRQQLFEVIFIKKVTTPNKKRQPVRCAKASPAINQSITIDVEISGR